MQRGGHPRAGRGLGGRPVRAGRRREGGAGVDAGPVGSDDVAVTLAGLPAKPDRATLVVVNPRRVEAIVSNRGHRRHRHLHPEVRRDAHRRRRTRWPRSPCRSIFDGKPLAVRVTATASGHRRGPDRDRDGDVAFAAGGRPIRGTTWPSPVPDGPAGAELVLSSVGRKPRSDSQPSTRSGTSLLGRTVAVPARRRASRSRCPHGTRYVRLVSDQPGCGRGVLGHGCGRSGHRGRGPARSGRCGCRSCGPAGEPARSSLRAYVLAS